MTKEEKIIHDVISLTDEQKVAFDELEKAIKKCRRLGIAIIPVNDNFYAVNWQNIYDIEPTYSDWMVYDVSLKDQQELPYIYVSEKVRTESPEDKIRIAFSEDVSSELLDC